MVGRDDGPASVPEQVRPGPVLLVAAEHAAATSGAATSARPVPGLDGLCSADPSAVRPYPEVMTEQPVSVSADGLRAASQHAATWEDAVRRAEHGETVAVIAHGEHVADVVPSGELDRLRETIAVLSDSGLMRELREGLADLAAGRTVPASDVAADLRARSANQ